MQSAPDTDDAPPASATPPSSFALPRRRIWPVVAVLAVVAFGIGFGVVRWLMELNPLRVLVAIDLDGTWWEGSEPAAVLADELAARLEELGFEPVRGGDPKVARALENAKTPKDAARKLGAGFLVEAHLKPEILEHPVKGGYVEVRTDAPVTLTYLPTGDAREGHVRGFAGAPEKKQALHLLADSMANQTLDAVITALLDNPAVKEMLEGSDPRLVAKLDPARSFAKTRTARLAEATEAYAARAKARTSEDKKPVAYHSGPAAEDLLAAVTSKGYLVKTADVAPFYSPKARDVLRLEDLETLAWRTPADAPGSAATPIWRGYHVFGYPGAAPEGAPIVLVEDLFGGAKTITAIDANGAARRLRVDVEHRFVDPSVAPKGKYAAMYDRPCAECDGALMVLELDGGKEVFGFDPANGSLAGHTWVDAHRLAFVYVPSTAASAAAGAPSAEPSQVLAIVDVAVGPKSLKTLVTAAKSEAFASPVASADGTRIALPFVTQAASGLAIVDAATGRVVARHAVGRAGRMAFSPDGKHVAFEVTTPNGHEIAVLTLASGRVQKLTDNRSDDRNPLFSADGTRVLFEARDRDPVFPKNRGLSRIASVAFTP